MNCQHEKITRYSRMISRATRDEPAEYSEWGECEDCGETLELEDVPDGVEVTEGDCEPPLRGMPDEFRD